MEHYLTCLEGFIQRICLDDNYVHEGELTMERYRGCVFRQYATERLYIYIYKLKVMPRECA